MEILGIFDVMLQSDISLMKTCNTLKPIWYQFVDYPNSMNTNKPTLRLQRNLINTDACLMDKIVTFQEPILNMGKSDLLSLIYQFLSQYYKNIQTTSFVSFAVHIILFRLSNKLVGNSNYRARLRNKTFYRPCRYLNLNIRTVQFPSFCSILQLW